MVQPLSFAYFSDLTSYQPVNSGKNLPKFRIFCDIALISKSVTIFTLFHLANTILNVCFRIKFLIEWCYIRVYGFSADLLVNSRLQRRNVLLFVFSRSIRHRGTIVRRHRNATSLCFFKSIRSNRYNTTHIIIPNWRGSFAVFGNIIYSYIVSCSDPPTSFLFRLIKLPGC